MPDDIVDRKPCTDCGLTGSFSKEKVCPSCGQAGYFYGVNDNPTQKRTVDTAALIYSAAMKQRNMSIPLPPPKEGLEVPVWSLVMKDMTDRDQFGRKKYGQPLKAHDGRDPLTDAYQEALDLAVYLRKAIFERDGK